MILFLAAFSAVKNRMYNFITLYDAENVIWKASPPTITFPKQSFGECLHRD
jgi:hypothetical protein